MELIRHVVMIENELGIPLSSNSANLITKQQILELMLKAAEQAWKAKNSNNNFAQPRLSYDVYKQEIL